MTSARRGLARLETNLLARVADALAVVGVGWPEGADVGCHLTDGLLVDAADLDLRGLRRRQGDPSGRLHDDRVREAEAELQVAALHLAAEAHAVDLEVAGVALRSAHEGVGQESPGQAVLGARLAVVALAGDGQHAVLDAHAERREHVHGQRALRALDLDDTGPERLDLDALRQADGVAAYARHLTTPRR